MGGQTKYENDTRNYWTRSCPDNEDHQNGRRTKQEGSTEKGIDPASETSNLHLVMSAGKGDTYRPVNAETYGNNYDNIFCKPKQDLCNFCGKWIGLCVDCDELTWEDLNDEG
jgi:hypothetical protein